MIEVNLTPVAADITLEGVITDPNNNNAVVDISAAQIWFTLKHHYDDPDGEAIVQVRIGTGITLTDPTKGKYQVFISKAQIIGLTIGETYYYDVQTSIDGIVDKPVKGTFILGWSCTNTSILVSNTHLQIKDVNNVLLNNLGEGSIEFRDTTGGDLYGTLALDTNIFTDSAATVAKDLKLVPLGGTPGTTSGTPLASPTVIDATNNKMQIAVNGGVAMVITLESGSWTTAEIAADIQSKIDLITAHLITVVESGGDIVLTTVIVGAAASIEIQAIANDCYTDLDLAVATYSGGGVYYETIIGDMIEIVYIAADDSIQKKTIWLPTMYTPANLWVADDGSTYYDAAMTSLAASAP